MNKPESLGKGDRDMPDNDPNQFPVPNPDNALSGPTGSPRRLSTEKSAFAKSVGARWFYVQVTYKDQGNTAQGYLSQYTSGAMYWDSYIIITPNPQTKFQVQAPGAWLSDAQSVTYKNPPFYLCVTSGPRYWVYLSNYYTDVQWEIVGPSLACSYVGGSGGFVPQDPPFYSRQLWACFD